MLWSILIPTIETRAHFLERLLSVLTPQVVDGVEILIEKDDGESKIGAKRNRLIGRATGDYVCGIDDDDLVTSDYVAPHR
jgi:hypothetical protein